MTDVKIPQPTEEMDEALYAWETAIHEHAHAQEMYLSTESIFKSWEALTKKTYMDHGSSAAASDVKVKCEDYWLTTMKDINALAVEAEKKKRLCRLAEARWETARTKQVTLRNVR